jgi:hypothetical protein
MFTAYVALHPPGLPIVTIFTAYRRPMLITLHLATRTQHDADDEQARYAYCEVRLPMPRVGVFSRRAGRRKSACRSAKRPAPSAPPRARTSGENLFVVRFVMTPSSQELGSPANPGRFKCRLEAHAKMRRAPKRMLLARGATFPYVGSHKIPPRRKSQDGLFIV